MTASREASAFALADLRARLPGRPMYRISVEEMDRDAQLCAVWPCGCVASGERFASLTLAACTDHREREN